MNFSKRTCLQIEISLDGKRDRALQLKSSFFILLKLRPLSLLKIVVWKLWNFDSLLFFSGCEELRRTFRPWRIFRCTRCRLAGLLQFRSFRVHAFPRNLQSDFSTLSILAFLIQDHGQGLLKIILSYTGLECSDWLKNLEQPIKIIKIYAKNLYRLGPVHQLIYQCFLFYDGSIKYEPKTVLSKNGWILQVCYTEVFAFN